MKKHGKHKVGGVSQIGDCDAFLNQCWMDGVIKHSIDLQKGEALRTFDSAIINTKHLKKIPDSPDDF